MAASNKRSHSIRCRRSASSALTFTSTLSALPINQAEAPRFPSNFPELIVGHRQPQWLYLRCWCISKPGVVILPHHVHRLLHERLIGQGHSFKRARRGYDTLVIPQSVLPCVNWSTLTEDRCWVDFCSCRPQSTDHRSGLRMHALRGLILFSKV